MIGSFSAGSIRDGGRFNPASSFRALYVSLDPNTALLELAQQIIRDALPIGAMFPRVMMEIDVDMSHVCDFTDPDTREAAGLGLDDILTSAQSSAARRRGF